MSYEKITTISPEAYSASPVADHISQLAQIFPSVVQEGKVDFEELRSLLGDYVAKEDELFGLQWKGKAEAKHWSTVQSIGTLRPCKAESVDWDTTGNLYIEGDNLEVIKLLRKSYSSRIKMIYIDPPYNTGKDFVYADNYQNGIEDYKRLTGQNGAFKANQETSGRYHTDWLNMMYPRLELARDLLKEDGVIFISIDDAEIGDLRKICEEIFGEKNFVAQLVWERAFSPKNDAKYVSNSHDYVVVYAKNIEKFTIGRLPRTEEANARYSNPDNDPRGVWMSSDISVKTYNAECDYSITTPSGRVVETPG
jgi:adenine-specific DNA-methyltransferase